MVPNVRVSKALEGAKQDCIDSQGQFGFFADHSVPDSLDWRWREGDGGLVGVALDAYEFRRTSVTLTAQFSFICCRI